jgi:type VI secretion system protein
VSIKIVALPHPQDALFSGSMHIPDRRFAIGRSDSNDWVLTDAKRLISKRHCFIEPFKGGHRIVDESTNGTSVNGKAVDRNVGQVLRQGDEIELGQYRFRVEGGASARPANLDEEAGQNNFGPKITSILHDIAPRGVGADSAVEGEKHDVFAMSKRAQGASAIAGFTKDLGWDAPPGEKVEVVKSPYDEPRANRDLIDKFEQAPADRMMINLPRPHVPVDVDIDQQGSSSPKPLIPDDWFDNDRSETTTNKAPAKTTARLPSPEIDTGSLVIIPVENINLDDETSDPQIWQINESVAAVTAEVDNRPIQTPQQQPTGQSRQVAELVSSFCAGAGVLEADLSSADLVQLFYNLGRVLAVSSAELHNNHVAKRKSLSRLEMGADTMARTPWIFSIGGENKEKVVSSVIAYLAEAEPRDLEIIRRDYSDISEFNEELSRAVLGLVDRVQRGLSAQELERHISSASKAIASLKKAALWDALLQHSGLFDSTSKADVRPDIMALLRAELAKKKQGQV